MRRVIGDVDELVTAVRHVAQGEANQIRQRAEEKADSIRREAQDRANRVRDEKLKHARGQAGQIQRQRWARLTREQWSNYLQAREELMGQVWQNAEEHLRSLTENESDYAEAMQSLALQAAHTLGPGDWVLAADSKGHELLTPERLKDWSGKASDQVGGPVSFERASEPLDTWGGIVVAGKQGRRRVDATFPYRLKLAREEIRSQVFHKLVTR